MRKLAFVFAAAAVLGLCGCDADGELGHLCSNNDECNEGLVCVSQVYNCTGTDCWGTCEQECVEATDCGGGETCLWIRTARICRPVDYESP